MKFRLPALALFSLLPSIATLSRATTPNFDDLSRRAAAALQSNPDEAVRLYRQALAVRPSWAEGWFNLGGGLYQLKQFSDSRLAFQHAAKLAPQNGGVWAFLGLCDYELRDYPQALLEVRKAEALGLPDDLKFVSAVRNHAALICIRASDFSAAVEQLKPLAMLGDDSPQTVQALGLSTLGISLLPSEIPPDKQPLIELAGRAAWALYAEHANDASALFHQLIAEYPNHAGAHYLYGTYLLDRDPDAAKAEFLKELQISPSHVPARLQIAILEIKAGNAPAARKLAEEATKLQPANPLSHAVLGRSFVYLDQYAKAVPELEMAVRLAPENPQLHFSLAQAYRRVGRTADAQKQTAEFNRLKPPDNPIALTEQ